VYLKNGPSNNVIPLSFQHSSVLGRVTSRRLDVKIVFDFPYFALETADFCI
jgi:hypothetical protein